MILFVAKDVGYKLAGSLPVRRTATHCCGRTVNLTSWGWDIGVGDITRSVMGTINTHYANVLITLRVMLPNVVIPKLEFDEALKR